MKNSLLPLALILSSSIVATTSYAHYHCGPKVNYDTNYRAQYRDPCPQKRTYHAFKKERLHKDHTVEHCANYGRPAHDSVEHQVRHDQSNCKEKHHPKTPCPPSCPDKNFTVKQLTGKNNGQYRMTYSPDQLAPFDSIVADGDTQVIINGGKRNSVQITTRKAYPTKLIDVEVRNHTLFLSRHNKRSWKEHAQQTVLVNIDVPSLRQLVLKDDARVTGYNIRTNRGLCIHTSSSGYSKLQGTINLTKLVHTGSGRLEIQWVESNRLQVIANNQGCIKLSGTVDTIDVRATEHAHLDAKYLRAHNALIQTGDMAEVDITAIDALSGFAADLSNIKYYKTPKHLTRHTYASGNVMQMRYWN